MFRLLSAAAFFAGLILLPSAALAQETEPVPTATADQIVYTGEVPAAPGTEVRAEYLNPEGEIVVCGTTAATDASMFVLVIDAECARGGIGPLICWAEGLNLCKGFRPDNPPSGGETIDTGLLSPVDLSEDPGVPPHGDRGPEIALPETGAGGGGASSLAQPRSAWLLWIGVAAIGAGLTAGALGLATRRR